MLARSSFATIAALTLAGWLVGGVSIAEGTRAANVPAPKVNAAPAKGLQTAVLAGGCFWGMEGVFEHLNRQGPDTGPSYRSAIFPIGAEQERVARAYLAQLSATKAYPRPIVTKIEHGAFYPAEAYHQGFMRKNPNHPYIRYNDAPKLVALKAAFPSLWRDSWSG